MKKHFFFLFLALSASTIWAYDAKIGDLYYNLDKSDKTATVTYKSWSNGNYNKGWSITTANIPSSVTYNATTYSVTSIGEYAFYDCSGLTSVTIPNSVTSIGAWAFCNCSSLTSPVYNAHVFAFMPKTYSGAYTIPDGIKTIAGSAFSNCTGLTSVTIPNSVTSIGAWAFSNCSSLTSPVYNAHIFAFMPKTYSGAYSIPDGIETIADNAFENCNSLTSITIPNSVTSIGEAAFRGCYNLTSATIGNSVTSIGSDAFYGCRALTSITIPNSVTSIGYWAFYLVANIVYSGTATGSPWWGARSVNGYVDGCLVYSDASKTTLLACFAAAQGEIVIPNSVTSIGEKAFYCCTSLTSITIPNSVTSIGDDAFYNVPNIVYSGTATGRPWGARSVNGYVDGYLVYSDASKTYLLACSAAAQGEVVIPSSVISIGEEAFDGCKKLTSIICYAVTPPDIDKYTWYDVDKSIPLYVPAGSVEAYKNADWWKYFTNILPIAGTSIESAEVKATPSSSNSVSVTWPEVSGATTYTIEIKKNGVLICTLVFNAAGQLESLTFAAPARDGARNVASAMQAGNGWTYTVTGLESNTEYTYTVIAKNASGGVLLDQTVGFKTPLPDGIEDVVSDSGAAVKTLYNGQVLIQRAGKTYTLQGQEVR